MKPFVLSKTKSDLIVFFVVMTPLCLFYAYHKWQYVNSNKLYTISNSTEVRYIMGQQRLEVSIEYKDKTYTIEDPVSSECILRAKIGDAFLVEFLEKKPNAGVILCDYVISDNILLPERGFWEKIPIELQKK